MIFYSSFKTLFTKYKEIILYLVFGVIATFISIAGFTVLYNIASLNEHLANIISWILAVSFAFITNRTWVFEGGSSKNSSFFKQAFSFLSGRILTLIVEEMIIFIFISSLNFNAIFIKTIAQFVVIVLNYFVSKFWVFKNDNRGRIAS